jgi:4'-phosphopantetheinyl transferase
MRASLELADGEIAVVAVAHGEPDANGARFAAVLSDDESARARRFHFERDRHAFVVSRGTLRLLLAAETGAPPASLAFARGANGKPSLASGNPRDVRFNVSHSGGVTLLAFARAREIGVDIEALRPLPERDAVARRFFSVAEADDLASLPEGERERAFFACWTRKEAFIKAAGAGLGTFALDRFRVSLRPGDAPRVLEIDGDAEAARDWNVHDIPAGSAYLAALAYAGAARPVRCVALSEREVLARYGDAP